ncbi:MAG: cupin domain-containing protein [Methylococcaceae bacterium]|nr:cupin domain-containing protein [Methylococcaceae bacterium]
MTEQKTSIQVWTSYWGALLHDDNSKINSIIYGFENESPAHANNTQATIADEGACFGFVVSGGVYLQDGRINWSLNAGQWFSLPNGLILNLTANSRVLVSQCLGYQGIYAMGGPIEAQGRLRYIDGCSDTLLCAPPLLGDPCLNHLHFPAGIAQTAHTHPSLRAGIIAKGQGVCEANQQQIPLAEGDLFCIPKDTEHRFITETSTMDVIAYHPDSDWGPTHDNHPMVNRTWVEGHKIDNHAPQHQAASIIHGR